MIEPLITLSILIRRNTFQWQQAFIWTIGLVYGKKWFSKPFKRFHWKLILWTISGLPSKYQIWLWYRKCVCFWPMPKNVSVSCILIYIWCDVAVCVKVHLFTLSYTRGRTSEHLV